VSHAGNAPETADLRDLIYRKKGSSGRINPVQEALSPQPYSPSSWDTMLVKDGPTMTTTPFLTLNLRGKKDAVLVRQRARRVASLLNFDGYEQACIAAGTFVVASQALLLLGKARICFQIDNQQLHVFAQEATAEIDNPAHHASKRLAGLFANVESKTLFRLTKPLPQRELAAEEVELGWLVNQVEQTACNGLFDEIVKQNQEILALLHELRLCQLKAGPKEEKSSSPHAA
jgi:hypothetical protein